MRAFLALALLGLAVLIAPPALAQEGGDPVAQCRDTHGENWPARVACLEAALTAPAPAEEAASGSRLPSWALPNFRQRQAEEEAPRRVDVRIVEVRYGLNGLGRFTTEDGQIWVETETVPATRRLREGRAYQAEIFRGPFGGFRMEVEGVVWFFKVQRLE